MTRRELIGLPLNREFEFTDGIYDYVMKKSMATGFEEPMVMQYWRIKGGNRFTESFSILEDIVQDEEYHYITYPYLRLHISCGGFSSHGDICYWQLGKLKLINNNSYKKWAERFKTEQI